MVAAVLKNIQDKMEIIRAQVEETKNQLGQTVNLTIQAEPQSDSQSRMTRLAVEL